jgi:hypothetical protein
LLWRKREKLDDGAGAGSDRVVDGHAGSRSGKRIASGEQKGPLVEVPMETVTSLGACAQE